MHHPAWKLLCTPAFTRQRSQLNVFSHMIKFSWLWNMYDEQWTVKIMYLLVLVFTLPVFQPLKSNKKVGSSEDEIEGEFYNFCCLCSLFSQLNKTLAMWPAKDWRAIQEGSKLSLLKKWFLSSSVHHIYSYFNQERYENQWLGHLRSYYCLWKNSPETNNNRDCISSSPRDYLSDNRRWSPGCPVSSVSLHPFVIGYP